MRKGILLFILSLYCLSPIQAQDFKVIGYLLYARFDLLDQMDLEKLTHLNIAFLNPDDEGKLQLPSGNIDEVIDRAHEADLEVFLSLAGGYLAPEWAAAWEKWMQADKRSEFIHKIIQYTLDHNCQGIDVDLEWQYVNEKYSPFVLELADSARAHNLQITAALPGTYRYPDISDEVLATYDWINMMVYDLHGPWAPNDPGPHSPMSFAHQSMAYWQNQGMPKERLTLGVPFYGYDFSGSDRVKAYTYRTILSWNVENAQRDQTGQTYYNGIPTIKAKTRLAMEELSGIMIWEIGQDDFGPLSLLNAIAEEVMVTSIPYNAGLEVVIDAFPNPFLDELQISAPQIIQQVLLFNAQGQQLRQFSGINTNVLQLNLGDLESGVYFLSLQLDKIHTIQLVKH